MIQATMLKFRGQREKKAGGASVSEMGGVPIRQRDMLPFRPGAAASADPLYAQVGRGKRSDRRKNAKEETGGWAVHQQIPAEPGGSFKRVGQL